MSYVHSGIHTVLLRDYTVLLGVLQFLCVLPASNMLLPLSITTHCRLALTLLYSSPSSLIQLSYEELKHVIEGFGFQFLHESWHDCPYTRCASSMMWTTYR